MSELKAYRGDIYIPVYGSIADAKVYLKSEADKVIAELNDKLQNVSSLLKETREWLVESQKLHKRCADNAVKIISHNKYKRCLAMAKLCVNGECKLKRVEMRDMNDHQFWQFDNDYWLKWNERWLELAENFKEVK